MCCRFLEGFDRPFSRRRTATPMLGKPSATEETGQSVLRDVKSNPSPQFNVLAPDAGKFPVASTNQLGCLHYRTTPVSRSAQNHSHCADSDQQIGRYGTLFAAIRSTRRSLAAWTRESSVSTCRRMVLKSAARRQLGHVGSPSPSINTCVISNTSWSALDQKFVCGWTDCDSHPAARASHSA